MTIPASTPSPVLPRTPVPNAAASRLGAGRRLATGTFWLLASTALGQGAGLLTAIVIARVLGREEFGAYGLLLNTVATLGIFAGLGLGTTATKYVAELRGQDVARAAAVVTFSLRTAVVMAGTVGLLMSFAAPWIADRWLNAPALAGPLRLASLLLFFNAVSGTQVGVLQGLEEFRTGTGLNLVRALLTLPLCVLGVQVLELRGAIAGLVAAAAVTVAISAWVVRRVCVRHGLPTRGTTASVDRGVLVHYALPALLGSVANLPALWIANVLLAQQPNGYAELGLLNASMQWRNMLLFLPTVVGQAALPVMAAGLATDARTGDLSRVWALAHGASMVVVFPVCVLLMFGGGPLLSLYGPEFGSGYVVLVAMIYSVMLVAAGGIQGTLLQARGAMWVGVGINVAWSAAFLVGVFAGVPRYGARAVALSMAGSYLVVTPLVFGYLWHRGHLPAGALRLTGSAVAFATVATAAGLLLPPDVARLLSIPAALLTAVFAATFLTQRSFRDAAVRAFRSLRARRHPSIDTGS